MTFSSNHNLIAVCIIALSASMDGAEDGAEDGAPGHAFFKKNCVKCHNAKKHKGKVRLDQLSLRVTDENHELWEEVVHNLQRATSSRPTFWLSSLRSWRTHPRAKVRC